MAFLYFRTYFCYPVSRNHIFKETNKGADIAMKENISFEFIKSDKTEPNIYYRIPKILFESSVFEDLSTDAKYLYSFMLDRVSLSSKNKWIDPDGRVYIIYTVKQDVKF